MKKLLTLTIAVATLGAAYAQNPMVGGMAMMASKTIVANAMNSPRHTTLVAAVKAAGLVDTLMSKGPFTVFAPTNDAFEDLPAGTVDMLLMPANKMKLTKVLTYHVVAGKITSKDHGLDQEGPRKGRPEHGRRRQALGDDEWPDQHRHQGRERGRRPHLDLRRHAKQRRNPRRRSRLDVEVVERGGR